MTSTNDQRPTTGDGRWHLAQYNIAWMTNPLDSFEMADFRTAIDPINKLAEDTPGFVWRHQNPDGNSTATRIRDDGRILINYSVWTDADSLFQYAFRTAHADVYRRRREWFTHDDEPYAVLWWIPAGHEPSVEEAEERLLHLKTHGASPRAFTFKQRFDPPSDEEHAAPLTESAAG